MWILLWSLQPVMFIFLGRFWCGISPFSTAGDLVQKLVGNDLHPPLFIKKYGVWFAYYFFIIILMIETLTHMSHSTTASVILLLSIFTMAMISGAFYKKRTWCRYRCPLGVTGGVFSRLRFFKLGKDNKICNECKTFECLQGNEKYKGCPVGLCVKKHDMDADCISCGHCLKNCTHSSPRIELISPARGFLSNMKMNQAEAAFASSFIGLSAAMYLIKDYRSIIDQMIGFQNPWMSELTILLGFTFLSFGFFQLFSYLIRPITGQSHRYNFRFFGFFLIPYIFLALFNLTSIHEVLINGMTLYYSISMVVGPTLPDSLIRPLISINGVHIIQGLGILVGGIVSVLFCFFELQKALHARKRNVIIALFSIFVLLITTYSLYFLMFIE